MIRRFIGTTAIAAMPWRCRCRRWPGPGRPGRELNEARGMANGPPARSAPWSAASSAAWSAASPACWASTSVRASAAMSSSSTALPINMARTSGSARCCPSDGVTYYDVPPEYGVHDYRYTVVNGRTVLVEPRTHRIVEIVE